MPDGDALADRELAEDQALLVALRLLEARGRREPARPRGADVCRRLTRHADAAASRLLPLLPQMAPVEDLIRLGNRVELAEEAAPTRPHPGTPATPPWNKVVDPAVAVVDKVRDVVSRRTTYPAISEQSAKWTAISRIVKTPSRYAWVTAYGLAGSVLLVNLFVTSGGSLTWPKV